MTEKKLPRIIAETERLLLRELVDDDLPGLCSVLQDTEVTYAYERIFSEREIGSWLKRQFQCYAQDGFGMWAVVLKETGKMIGHAGISMQVYGDEELPEIGYMFEKAFWHQGFATEAVIACRDYAFAVLGMDTVYSVIRADNAPSRAVARRNGMRITGTAFKSVMGRMVTHYMYSIKKPNK